MAVLCINACMRATPRSALLSTQCAVRMAHSLTANLIITRFTAAMSESLSSDGSLATRSETTPFAALT